MHTSPIPYAVAIARITPGGFSSRKPSPCAFSTGQSGAAGLGRRARQGRSPWETSVHYKGSGIPYSSAARVLLLILIRFENSPSTR
ncbi:MAG: hypothetical protein KME46_13465 [Brasilonema angustatum HA4187-MV1]|nr:hypothetical protein [Brasilonema angustatum HA4187-MV1]